jgi:hypothetical protein
MITRVRLLAVGVCAVTAVAGCAHRTVRGPDTTVIVTVTRPAASPSTSPVASAQSPTAPASSSVAAAPMHALPGSCESLLPLGSVVDTLGHPVTGDTAFVVGLPDSDTGRVSYLNCRYGVTKRSSGIEIGVSLYRTSAKAAARIAPTVEDYTAHGATSSPVTVAGMPATMLAGGQGAGYGPTVVLSSGQRTVAVTVAGGGAAELVRLAQLAADRTSAS